MRSAELVVAIPRRTGHRTLAEVVSGSGKMILSPFPRVIVDAAANSPGSRKKCCSDPSGADAAHVSIRSDPQKRRLDPRVNRTGFLTDFTAEMMATEMRLFERTL